MSSELSAYEAAIRDLEAERQEIDSLIDALRRRIAKAGGEVSASSSARHVDATNIPDDAFFGMTLADAARKYLSIIKQTKTTAEIANALVRGGLKSSATDLPSTVRSIIGPRDEFMRVNGKWGLSIWYPGAKRSKQGREEEVPARTKEPKKDRKIKSEAKKDSKKPAKAAQAKNNAPLVIKFLTENPGSHPVDKIAEAIDASNVPSLRALLSVMVGDGRIKKGTPTGYAANT